MTDSFDELFSSDTEGDRSELRETWDLLGDLDAPEPPSGMRHGNARALAAYEAALGPPGRHPSLGLGSLMAIAASIALVAGGLGGFMLGDRQGANGRLSALESRVEALQRSQVFAMLGHSSTPERLRGVRLAGPLGLEDEALRRSLLERATLDKNLNVRLAAIEAIEPLADDPSVQRVLVAAVIGERSPIVQAALLDLLILHRARSLLPVLEDLSERVDVLPEIQAIATRGRSTLQS